MDRKDVVYSLSRFGEDLINAMPDRKAVATVKRKYARLAKKQKTEKNSPNDAL